MMVSSVFFVFLFTVLMPRQIFGQTSVNCQSQNFSPATMNRCCKRPPVVFAVDPYLKQCNPKKDSRLTQWANGYVLNKVQNYRMGNTLNITSDPAAISLLCSAGPFMNCLFISGGFLMKNGAYNLSAINSYVMSKAPSGDKDWKQILKDLMDQANPLESWIPKAFKNGILCPGAKYNSPKVKVNISSVVLTQIFQMALINNCPEPVETNSCFATMDKFYDCTDYVWESLSKNKLDTNNKRRKDSRRTSTKRVESIENVKEIEETEIDLE